MAFCDMIKAQLQFVHDRIHAACFRIGREPNSVRLIAVTKTFPVGVMREALAAGQFLFGENYVQEAQRKVAALGELVPEFELHLIGPLQRNKVKHAVGLFSMIQTVDRVELAQEIQKVAEGRGIVQSVLMQVNISGEESKSGVLPGHAASLAKEILSMPNLRLQGLMSIGSFVEEDATDGVRRREFKMMSVLRDELEVELKVELPELSMGMSHDFELAVEEGATLVRVGSLIFGERGEMAY